MTKQRSWRGALSRAMLLVLLSIGLLSSGALLLGIGGKRAHKLTFPPGFLWGAATAAHQVEGGNTNNDWYDWEQRGRTKEPSGIAVDHYNRYLEDFDLAASLGHNAYRMSVEWSRIEPERGVYSREVMLHYRAMLKAARDRGLKTFVTLHHFTTPLWATKEGTWADPEIVQRFGDFAAYIIPNIGDLVDSWITLNEPNVVALLGYGVGITPPGMQDQSKLGLVLANFMKAHAKAYHLIKAFFPNAPVGFAHHMRVFAPYRSWHPGDVVIARIVDDFWNNQILRAMKTGEIKFKIPFILNYSERWPELEGTLDFVGINYYTRDYLKLDLSAPQKFVIVPTDKAEHNDLGWEIYPHGIYTSIAKAASFGYPIYITENGIADAKDEKRKAFICDHLREVAQAIADGMDVRGYLYWSLLDNFEWVDGFKPRFGLVEIDYSTLSRTVRPSARAYSEIIRTGGFDFCDPRAGS